MQLNRYEMLTKLHEVVKPRTYLEIGVQTGASFTLAKGAQRAIGVDPDFSNLTFDVNWPHAMLVDSTSDEFFASGPHFVDADGQSDVDLVFIDGMHRVENVARDLIHVAHLSHFNTVIVLDDVLPRNNEEANRDMVPGDWTGDVYKIFQVLREHDYRNRDFWRVDTFPTGMLIMMGRQARALIYELGEERFLQLADQAAAEPVDVPPGILQRRNVTAPQTVLDLIQEAIHG